MVYLKWVMFSILDILLLPTLLVAPFLIALFTREQEDHDNGYTWGWIWGTHDNPPQGDKGFVSKRAFFPNVTTGWKGYVNRVQWMWRNKLYGLAKYMSLPYNPNYRITLQGDPNISDKDKRPGSYLCKVYDGSRLVGFEYYSVWPYSNTRNIRVRLGWKIATDKYERYGFAQHVLTFNPFDGYGDA